MKLPVDFRLLKERYFGAASRRPWVAEKRLEELVPYLQPETAEIARRAVTNLMAYQDPDYALLYLSRLARYAGPDKTPPAFLADIATRLDRRMRYADPPGAAQAALVESSESGAESGRHVFCLCDIVGLLPPRVTDRICKVLSRLGWSDRTVELHFVARGGLRRRWTRMWTLLRYVRKYSQRAKIENAWVERWLHMIDRVHRIQPDAVIHVVRSADLVEGEGPAYHRSVANWHVIVDRLIKPTCDGSLTVDLAAVLPEVLSVAEERPEAAVLAQRIDSLVRSSPAQQLQTA